MDPQKPSLYREKAIIENRVSNYAASLEDVNTAITLGDKDVRDYVLRGLLLMKNGKYTEAIPDFSMAISLGGKPYVSRAFSYVHIGQYKLAIEDYIEADKTDSVHMYCSDIASCYAAMGDYTDAISTWKKKEELLLTRGFKNSSRYELSSASRNICILWSILGNYDSALVYIKKAVEYYDGYPEDYYYRGVIDYKLKRYQEAIHNLEKADSLGANSYLSDYLLSSIYARNGDRGKALDYFDRALQKGFRFFDLVSENDEFRQLEKDSRYTKLLRKYAERENIYGKGDTLRQVMKRGKIVGAAELDIASERVGAIFYMQSKRNELQKLQELEMSME